MERKENGGRELNAVSLEERVSALEFAGDWLTDYLDGKIDYGAFSEGAIGCPAVEFFTMRAFEKLMSGRWKWKEGKKMSTLMIDIMLSDMVHWVRDWKNNGC